MDTNDDTSDDTNDPTPRLEQFSSYDDACRLFKLNIPEHFNIANAICKRHVDAATRLALMDARAAGSNFYTLGGLDFISDKFAVTLARCGINEGEAVAIILPQSAALVAAHLGALKVGGVAALISLSLEQPAIESALRQIKARAVVADFSIRSQLAGLRERVSTVQAVFIATHGRQESKALGDAKDFWLEINKASSDFTAVDTLAASPATIILTSGAGGKPQFATRTHASMIAHLTAFEMINNFDFDDKTVFWSSADWAASGDLLDIAYPALWYGRAVAVKNFAASARAEFFDFAKKRAITDAFLTLPEITALIQGKEENSGSTEPGLQLFAGQYQPRRRVHFDWTQDHPAIRLNNFYATPETGILATDCARWFAPRKGSQGRIVPGRIVEVINERGDCLPAKKAGRIAIPKPALSPLPASMNENAGDRFDTIGDWLLTGDRGFKDEDGYLWINQTTA